MQWLLFLVSFKLELNTMTCTDTQFNNEDIFPEVEIGWKFSDTALLSFITNQINYWFSYRCVIQHNIEGAIQTFWVLDLDPGLSEIRLWLNRYGSDLISPNDVCIRERTTQSLCENWNWTRSSGLKFASQKTWTWNGNSYQTP